jgi:hypothetical protein
MCRFTYGSRHASTGRGGAARLLRRLLITGTIVSVVATCSSLVATALANTYNGLLYQGTTSASASGNAYAANSVVSQQSWTAPGGVQFNGFAYTSATFGTATEDLTGGLSSGFTGSGGNAPTDVSFPWTNDCSISESTPRIWMASGAQVAYNNYGPTGVAPGACNTTGNPSWDLTNAEAESTNPGVDPQTTYQTLRLEIWCARDANCSSGDAANYSVTNLSGSFSDPNSAPSGSSSWNTSIDGSNWYQSNTGNLKLNVSASDPAGVCSMNADLNGPSNVSSGGLGNQNPGVAYPGSPFGGEFAFGLNPCWVGLVASATWTLPPGIAAGTYATSVQASNPGDYEAQGFSASGSPTVATAAAINVDDVTPELSWNNPASGWTSETSETLDVTVGPSGLASLNCSDNGGAVTPVLSSGSRNGSGTTAWTIPTGVTGANTINCVATNGDANGGLTGSVTATFDVDAVVPTVAFHDPGYVPGSWTNTSQMVDVVPTVGPSGLRSLDCTLDGNNASLSSGTEITVGGNSPSRTQPHVVSCYAVSLTGESDQANPATFDVAIDTDTPTATFGGAAADGTWASGTPTVVVTGGEQNTSTGQPEILSGVSSISCTVNGAAVSTPPLTSGFATSFQLTSNGANQISCVPTTGAGTVGHAFTETVNVDNPANNCSGSSCNLTKYGSSPLIDDGADPYSNGPSQTTWYRTPQPITITANLPSGQAPVASISCTGALSGTWPLSNLNTDSAGGEEITVNVSPPGGQLNCTAKDMASNVYQLGSYQFEQDNTAPNGQFDQLSASTPDDIQVSVDDPGGSLASGVGYVHVYATNTSSGAVYDLGLAHLAGGKSADVYDVNLDDADAPAGTYKFDAEVGDIAGNTADLTAGPQGSTTVWQLPLRDNTQLTMVADDVNGAIDSAVPGGLQADVPNTSTNLAGVGSTLEPVTVHGSVRGRLARDDRRRAVAARASAAKPPKCGPSAKAAKQAVSCKAGASAVVTVGYGRKLIISGTLHNIKARNNSIAGATIDVWVQVAGSKPSLIGRTKTNAKGAYKFTAHAGASRNVYVTYAGTRKLRAAVTQIRERFTGRVTLVANQAAAGKRLTLAGRVTGGHVPAHGLNVTVDGKIVGYPGSQQLGTVHTNARGAYRYSIKLPSATRGLTYRLWLVVQSRLNPGWPYLGARSRALTRKVG